MKIQRVHPSESGQTHLNPISDLDASATLRMLISFLRCITIKDESANSPRHVSTTDMPVATTISEALRNSAS
jgi:hypothetical protein